MNRMRVLITGRLRNMGRGTPSVSQFARFTRDGRIVLFGRMQGLAPGREIRVVAECEQWEALLRKLLAQPDPDAFFDSMVRVGDVPPELARHLNR